MGRTKGLKDEESKSRVFETAWGKAEGKPKDEETGARDERAFLFLGKRLDFAA